MLVDGLAFQMYETALDLAEALASVALRYGQPLSNRARPGRLAALPVADVVGAGDFGQPGSLAAASAVRPPALARLEAVLLLAHEPLGSRKLAHLANLADGTEARTLVRRLNCLYDEEGCAFQVVEVAGGFQLMTRPHFAPWLRRLARWPEAVRLSPPAMETLAVVAYRQPVVRAEVEAIRGVQCGDLLRQLMERDLVRIVGRSDELGRPYLYGTTRRFLEVFGLRHLDELPQVDWPPAAAQPSHPKRTTDQQASAGMQSTTNLAQGRGSESEDRS